MSQIHSNGKGLPDMLGKGVYHTIVCWIVVEQKGGRQTHTEYGVL